MAKTRDSTSKLKLAVVILNYNGVEHLKKYLHSVRNEIPDYSRLYIADNASTDESVAFLQKEFPAVDLILLPENAGYAGGYNEALHQIDAEYYFLVNSDVELKAGAIHPLVTFLDSRSEYAACQPKVLSLTEPDCFEHAGAGGGWLDRLGYPFCRGRILSTTEKDEGQYDDVSDIFWATGAALMIRAADFRRAGKFDADFFAHMEEIDLCWRLQRLHRKIAVVPSSVIYHLGGGTLDYTHPRKTYLNFRNSLLMLLKNESSASLLWLLPVRLVLDGVAGIRFAMSREWKNLSAICRAHFSFYRYFSKFRKKRKDFKKHFHHGTPTENRKFSGRFGGSVIWNYYILKKKIFSELPIYEEEEKRAVQNHI